MRISPEGKISLEDHADTVGLVGMITSFRSPTRSPAGWCRHPHALAERDRKFGADALAHRLRSNCAKDSSTFKVDAPSRSWC